MTTSRERARTEVTRAIVDAGRRQMAEQGAAALSLRAVAREVGMVSSAVYRYVASRDELLTALIVEAYDALGDACERAEGRVRRGDHHARWMALTRAARRWAVANPHEYALIFGSPVPGFAAPQDTILPAARVPLLIATIVRDSGAASSTPAPPMAAAVRADLRGLGATLELAVPEAYLGRVVMAWTALIGSISMELFGHLHNVIHRYEPYFAYQMAVVSTDLGLR